MRQGKVWGETRLLTRNPFVELHHLTIAPYSKCSFPWLRRSRVEIQTEWRRRTVGTPYFFLEVS
jgi:hypothetical protein